MRLLISFQNSGSLPPSPSSFPLLLDFIFRQADTSLQPLAAPGFTNSYNQQTKQNNIFGKLSFINSLCSGLGSMPSPGTKNGDNATWMEHRKKVFQGKFLCMH